MEFLDLVKARRSVRQFKNNPVSDEQLEAILEAARWAPSAGNTQCQRYFVIRDPEIKKRIATESGHQLFIEQAPVVIVAVADLDAVGRGYGDRGRNTYALQDTAAAIQNIHLAATSMGLGSCWVGAFDEGVASQILDLPENMRPLAIIPIGVPDEPTTRIPPRRKIGEITKFI